MQTESLEQELALNDVLPDPFNDEQHRGMAADLQRAQRDYANDGEGFLAQCLVIVARWGARAGRKYASDRIEELRADNALLLRTIQDLAVRVELLEQVELGGASSRRH